MPISLDDQARLPPLTPYDEVAERQRLADMKAFRQYLVETGAVKALVKLYQHTAKNEMRLDNPTILKEFLTDYVVDAALNQEREALTEENAALRDRQIELQQQAQSLAQELDDQQRLAVGKSLWRYLVSAEFWEGELDDDTRATGLPIKLLYRRLCGNKVDKQTRTVLVDILRPVYLDENELLERSIPMEAFSQWIATGVPEELHAWCRDDLLPRFSSTPSPTDPPFERELLAAIRKCNSYPNALEDVRYAVDLEPQLLDLLSGTADKFGT